jgi:hypothetical protein
MSKVTDIATIARLSPADLYFTMRGHSPDDAFYEDNNIEPVTPERIEELTGHLGVTGGVVAWNADRTAFSGRYTGQLPEGAAKSFGKKGVPLPCTLSGTPTDTLVIAEGKSKEITFARLGYYACSAGGVNGIYNRHGFAKGFPDVNPLTNIIVAFDSNIKNNPKVWYAFRALIAGLRKEGPHLNIFALVIPDKEDGSLGDDIDDYCVDHDDAEAAQMIIDNTHRWTMTDQEAEVFGDILYQVHQYILDEGNQGTIVGEPLHFAKVMGCSFWDGTRLQLMHGSGSLVDFAEKDCMSAIKKNCGALFKVSGAEAKQTKAAYAKIKEETLGHLRYHNQRKSLRMHVDMFANDPRIVMRDEYAEVVYTHQPWVGGEYDQAIVDDFIEHFPQFEAFLTFIVASRFARDRKRAYLWLHCPSDWGKGFLIAVLSNLGVVVEMSVKEVEKVFEGGPVGRSMKDYKRCFALVIDEMKTVKSETKQLQNEMTLSPKNQLTQTVEIYAKIFMSAEHIPSLAGENGVEDQFANRLSLIQGEGSLTTRPLFKSIGQARYIDSITAFAIEQLNSQIAGMVEMGRAGAEEYAQLGLDEFYESHKIEHKYERFSESNVQIAREFHTWLGAHLREGDTMTEAEAAQARECSGLVHDPRILVHHKTKALLLTSPTKAFEEFVEETIDKSARYSIMMKAPDILKHLGEQLNGGKAGKFPTSLNDQTNKRGILLKKTI